MLVKEYRISLPMSVEEYRIAQLYMIQKKSREESEGTGSGVEILVNEQYEDGPGGSGQYTYKIYHIGSHLPGWFRAILPKSALRVEEKAWNAYPYTKTCYRCPFVEKFSIEIETIYDNDGGDQENIFNLSSAEKRQASVDYLDIVKDQISSGDYKQEEDPKLYQSIKTGRGPLNDNWRQEYSEACKAGKLGGGRAIMTAYKVCRVEFKYWGMQNKIERFIHDIALRKTMLRAHRQAWCWQDEWYGLTLADIRNLERETALALAEKMAAAMEGEENNENNENRTLSRGSNRRESIPETPTNSKEPLGGSKTPDGSGSLIKGHFETRGSHSALRPNMGSNRELANWRIESLEQLQESYSDSDEEFFDASEGEMDKEEEEGNDIMLPRSSSMDLISSGDEYYVDARSMLSENLEESNFGRRVEHFRQIYSLDSHGATGGDITPPTSAVCPTKVLFIVLHGGSILDSSHETTSKRSDFATLRSTFDSVIQSHYQAAMGQIAFRLVSCPLICSDTLSVLSSLSPFGLDCQSPNCESNLTMNQDFVPLGAISLFASSSLEYQEHVGTVITKVNGVYQEFLQSEEGRGFSGQICFLADSTGSLMAYDALARSTQHMRSRCGSHNSLENEDEVIKTVNPESRVISQSDPDLPQIVGNKTSIKIERSKSEVAPPECELERPCFTRQSSGPRLNVNRTDLGTSRRTSAGSYFDSNLQFDFDVSDLFMFGSPLAMVLAYRRLFTGDDKHSPPLRPSCHQVYNLFHSNDPTALRIEPLLHNNFKHIEPIKIPRHSKFPLGDGESIHVVEAVQQCLTLFNDGHRQSVSPGHPAGLLQRQSSSSSITSATSGVGETTVASITNVTSKWWGNKRVDYVLYCPEVLHSFPVSALPHLFHASFWESTDVVAFILRQILRLDVILESDKTGRNNLLSNFTITEPREKWLRRRTTIKVRNLQPNHRANDVIVLEDKPQVLTARFMYGSLDMTSLSGEKVDIHIMIQPASGEWIQLGTEITDNHGRLIYTIPEDKRLNQGMYPVKIVVKGDHTSVDFFLTVLPPKTETVVFSIDGAFTASVSIMGKDPKIRSGAVDVVRHWQELGYLILYVTARPDMQHRKVVTWLAQHNFPHGMVAFMDGISKDPLRQKLNYLKYLQAEANISYKAGYGSNKDIGIYKELNLSPSQIYAVGKASKKQHSQAQILSNGYAAHLYDLTSPGGSRPAVGNARIFLRKTCFRLPSLDTKRSARRTVSNTQSGGSDFLRPPDSGSTDKVSTSCGGRSLKDSFAAVRLRGKSPSTKSST